MSFKIEQIMSMLKDLLAKDGASYVGKIGGTYSFVASKGGSKRSWFIDLKNGSGSIEESSKAADCTISADDGTFFDLFSGKADAQELFFGGKLTIDGDMGLAMNLSALTEGAKL